MLGTVGNVVRRQNPAGLVRFTTTAFSSLLSRPLSYAAEDTPALPSSSEKENAPVLGTKPKPLSLDRTSPLRVTDPAPIGLSGIALKLLGFYSRESQLIRGSRTLYTRISAHVDAPELYASKDGSKVGQALYEVFNHDLEKRIVEEGVKMLISKWMKELERNFYGAVEAYDASMQPNADKDALARAFWRNVFAEDDSPIPTGAEAAAVKSFARYVRREAACLAVTDSESLLSGNIIFSSDFDVLPAALAKDSASQAQDSSDPLPA